MLAPRKKWRPCSTPNGSAFAGQACASMGSQANIGSIAAAPVCSFPGGLGATRTRKDPRSPFAGAG